MINDKKNDKKYANTILETSLHYQIVKTTPQQISSFKYLKVNMHNNESIVTIMGDQRRK